MDSFAGEPLRCGRIRYTNDLPIYAAFDCGALSYPGSLHADVPAALNDAMREGRLDVSPISAFAYARDFERYVLLPDLCIGARDEVVSVVLVSSQPPALLNRAKIAVTRESASGRNLLRVLLERRYEVYAEYEVVDDALTAARAGRPTLLIGDDAIDAVDELEPSWIYDLGRLWHDWTGEQTVFAVWVARRALFDARPFDVIECVRALTDSYTWSRAHMDVVVAAANAVRPRREGFYERYYAKLNFTFHSAARQGFAKYCDELSVIGAIDRIPPVVPEVLGVPR